MPTYDTWKTAAIMVAEWIRVAEAAGDVQEAMRLREEIWKLYDKTEEREHVLHH